MILDDKHVPVLIGCGQETDRNPPETGKTPVDMMANTARLAARDAGPGARVLQALDTVVAVGLVVDSMGGLHPRAGKIRSVPHSVCKQLGITPDNLYYTSAGGNTPQYLVNQFADRIASGDAEAVLLTGADAQKTMVARLKGGLDLDDWEEDLGADPVMFTGFEPPATPHEMQYDLHYPIVSYALFENALRKKYNITLDEQRARLGALFHPFSQVAAQNPLAWFPIERSESDIADVSTENRYVGFPYTKYMNAVMRVNMGASVIMTSLAKAKELGVADDRMIFLHGGAEANDIWNVTERTDYVSSPAIRAVATATMDMANVSLSDVSCLDIYSCFPSAVQIACDEIGVAHDDPRGLTVTGGLPYFGGPGNNYAMHSIAEMMTKLRAQKGAYGLVTANGWYLTKHAMGLYSTQVPTKPWQRSGSSSIQKEITDQPGPAFTEKPSGRARVETYTILHGRGGVKKGIVIGRLQDETRFLAELPREPSVLQRLVDVELLEHSGEVSQIGDKNVFTPQ